MTGTPVRPASTVIALRPAADGFDVLMVRRAGASAFMGGAHVFPGGAVDEEDRAGAAAAAVTGDDGELHAWWAAALRELAEEAGVFVTSPPAPPDLVAGCAGLEGTDLYRAVVAAGCRFDAARLAYLSNWVTPEGPPRRFDTRFFVVEVPAGTPAAADGHEVTGAEWVSPATALARAGGEWHVPFPTRWHLELLAAHPSAAAVMATARDQDAIARIAPRVVRASDGPRIVMPGDPGYADAPAESSRDRV